MRVLQHENGMALVTALMLTMLALVVSMALLYSITTEMRVTASQKRYRSALAASEGGVELLGHEIFPRIFDVTVDATRSTADAKLSWVEKDLDSIHLKLNRFPCLQQKLHMRSSNWNACEPPQLSSDPAVSPDMVFTLKGWPRDFTVSSKIVDTVPGNSDKNSRIDYLDSGGSVAGRDEAIRPQHVPGMYHMSVQGESEGGGQAKARLSVLYAY